MRVPEVSGNEEGEARSVDWEESEVEFLEVGPNGSAEPRVDWIGVERVVDGVGTLETHLLNVEGLVAEKEHAVHEDGEAFEKFGMLMGIVAEVKH